MLVSFLSSLDIVFPIKLVSGRYKVAQLLHFQEISAYGKYFRKSGPRFLFMRLEI